MKLKDRTTSPILCGQELLNRVEGEYHQSHTIRILYCKQYSIMNADMVGGQWDMHFRTLTYCTWCERIFSMKLTHISKINFLTWSLCECLEVIGPELLDGENLELTGPMERHPGTPGGTGDKSASTSRI